MWLSPREIRDSSCQERGLSECGGSVESSTFLGSVGALTLGKDQRGSKYPSNFPDVLKRSKQRQRSESTLQLAALTIIGDAKCDGRLHSKS